MKLLLFHFAWQLTAEDAVRQLSKKVNCHAANSTQLPQSNSIQFNSIQFNPPPPAPPN